MMTDLNQNRYPHSTAEIGPPHHSIIGDRKSLVFALSLSEGALLIYLVLPVLRQKRMHRCPGGQGSHSTLARGA